MKKYTKPKKPRLPSRRKILAVLDRETMLVGELIGKLRDKGCQLALANKKSEAYKSEADGLRSDLKKITDGIWRHGRRHPFDHLPVRGSHDTMISLMDLAEITGAVSVNISFDLGYIRMNRRSEVEANEALIRAMASDFAREAYKRAIKAIKIW